MIAKGAVVTVWFIQNVGDAKRRVLAALFDKGEEGMIDEVLGRINYDDGDLCYLTKYRPELAGSPEKFFRVLDKIKESGNAREAVRWGVRNLFRAGKHDLVVPLMNALGKRTFKSKRLKEEAIQRAFYEGARRGNQNIVEEYYEHPAITSGEYADGLYHLGTMANQIKSFRFYWSKLTKGTWIWSKRNMRMNIYTKFRQAIDEAPKPVPPAGSRHRRLIEMAQCVLEVLAPITSASDPRGSGSIIASYIIDEEIWAKEIERMKMEEKSQGALQEGKQEQSEVVQVQEGGGAQVQARQEGGRKKARRGLKRRQQHKKRSVRRRHQRRR